MKIDRFVLQAWLLIAACILPMTAKAQFNRSRGQSEAQRRAEDEARARAVAQAAEQRRQAELTRDLQHLQNTTRVLEQSFANHLRTHRRADADETLLAKALTDLAEDVDHLTNDVFGRCSKCARGDLQHIFRTFHMLEYSADNAQRLSFDAGYGRSLMGYFRDIDEHMDGLAEAGLRNPRLEPIVRDRHVFQGGAWFLSRRASTQPPRDSPGASRAPRRR
ncbi:MAG: hypothetical protein KDK97_03050 [Verrucomicrobiales bacterium]|nr:hypothetical protein [Verrucomicrobiales bacterium]MCP5560095.1 hypothetical protein [Verrucomicrobiaceae bacterium]